jgi:hypothetical protein
LSEAEKEKNPATNKGGGDLRLEWIEHMRAGGCITSTDASLATAHLFSVKHKRTIQAWL